MIDGYEAVVEDSFPPGLVILSCDGCFVGTMIYSCFGFYVITDCPHKIFKCSCNIEFQLKYMKKNFYFMLINHKIIEHQILKETYKS